MRQTAFSARHGAEWAAMEGFLDAADRLRRGPPPPFPSHEFPARYRRVCQHLAIARARGYSHALHERLHQLVLRAHARLYGVRRPRWRAALRFLLVDYPRLVGEEWPYLLAAGLLFMGPLLALLAAIQWQPELTYTVLAPAQVVQIESMYDPQLAERVGREREADTDFAMFGFYVRNNTSIGFQTFVGGTLFGLGTVFFLVFNGLYIGAVAGHLTHLGYTQTFWGFVAGHSAFELTAIMLSGAAGLRVGMALIAPRGRTRRLALREAMLVGLRLMYGAAALFLAAAFVEAFWSSIAWLAPITKYAVGVALWLLVAAYLLLGRRHAA